MLAVIKIRIYPKPEQVSKLAQAFGSARWLYNNQLEATQKVYKETGKGLSQFAMNNRIPELKKEFEWLSNTHSQVLQAVSLNLSRAFINFFEKRAGFPKFKSKQDNQSIQYPQGIKLEENKIYLPKLGLVKAVVHRAIVGNIKTVTISKTTTNKYFASILTENELPEVPVSYAGNILGIDVGLTHLAITSNGSKYNNEKNTKKAEVNLKRKQQKLSKKKKGSKNRIKAKLKVAKVHERIANKRRDYLHKLSTKLVNENQVIAVEDLNVKGMVKNHKLSKAIQDASWNIFTGFLKYKAGKYGKGYIEVNRYFPSSKTCNCCMHVQKLSLGNRFWTCDKCNTYHDRDINAARNIRDEAFRMITAGSVVTAYGGGVSRKKGGKPSVFAPTVEIGSPCL